MSEYRFFVNEHDGNGAPTIIRGRSYQMGGYDNWEHYWGGDEMVAVYDDRDYRSPTSGDWTDRAEHVVKMCREYDVKGQRQDVWLALNRLALRLFDHDAPLARFIPVNLDRGVTIYCLSWDGDPDHTWAREIEAVAYDDVWRIEVEEYNTFTQKWEPSDDMCEEWYGEGNAEAAFEKEFPLAEFPAHLVIEEAVGA